MVTIEEIIDNEALINNINNDNLSASECVEYTERYILVKKCLDKIYNLYTNFHKNNKHYNYDPENNEYIKDFNSLVKI